jgi:hypothetical protein
VVVASEALAAVRNPPFRLSTRFEWAAVATAVLVATGAIALLLGTAPSQFETLTPGRAVAATGAYLASHPGATVLADNDTASALLWAEPVSLGRVAFDARLEQYKKDDLRRWFRFINVSGPDWLGIASKYDVLLVSRQSHRALATRLVHLNGWRTIYSDAAGVVLVRSGS